jgi:hypothetical protein
LDHLENYLRHYETLEKPGYAVLVTGEWGVGKTTQVKQVLGSIFNEQCRDRKDPKEHVYVSLFGIASVDEVDAEVVAQINPGAILLTKIARFGGQVAGIVRGGAATAALAAKLSGPILRRELQNNDGRTIVFDDLERSKFDSKLLAGVLNRYIEHFGFRVILIAQDEKFAKDFNDIREKMIGQTIRVQPQTDAAWNAFTNQIKSKEKRDFIRKHEKSILAAFADSTTHSLRILRHVIEDVGRLFDAMDDELVANDMGCTEYLSWFAKFDALARNGVISPKNILNPDRLIFRKVPDESVEAQSAVKLRLASSAMHQAYRMNVVETKIAEQIFIHGHYDEAVIKLSLKQSAPFYRQADQPAWQRVWHRFEVDADDFLAARDQMETQFYTHSFTMVEEILHVFGLRLDLANDRLLGRLTLPEVEQQCRDYLQVLEADRLFGERPLNDRFTIDSLTGAFGLGFSGSRYEPMKSAFERLFNALKESYRSFVHAGLPAKAEEMLSLLGDSVGFQAFFENRAVRDLPIFTAIVPGNFVAGLLATPTSRWRDISVLLEQRFNLNRDLVKQERENIQGLIGEIDCQGKALRDSNSDKERLLGLRLKWFFSAELRGQFLPEDEAEKVAADGSA